MVLIELALIATSVGITIQTHKKPQKKVMVDLLLTEQKQDHHSKKAQNKSRKKVDHLSRFNGKRGEQLTAISSVKAKIKTSDVEKATNRDLALSLGALGCAVGAWLYPPLVLGNIIGLAYYGLLRYKAVYQELVTKRKITINLLDAITITSALVGGFYFLGALGCVMSAVGRELLVQIKDISQKNLINIFGEQPHTVWLLIDGGEIETLLEDLQKGDVVVVYAGQTIPVDGTIVFGMALIDQHQLTGEAQPAEKGPDEMVFAATVVLSGEIHVRVEKTGTETRVAQIGHILSQTADFKLAIQSRSEVLADKSVLPTLAIGGLALPILGVSGAIAAIYCPLGWFIRITGPLSLLNFLHILSLTEILVKDARSLELLPQIDTVVFDKTGTLTAEQPQLSHIHTCLPLSEDELLQYAATAEWKQTHPIARAILVEAEGRGLSLYAIEDVHYEVGYGIKIESSDQVIRVGSDRFMEIEGVDIPLSMRDLHCHTAQQGHTLVMVALNDQLAGAIELETAIRPEVKAVIQNLHQRNKTTYIISGDQEQPTKNLANQLGIDHYIANALPDQKAELIDQLIKAGKSVCFVGDGINDSIALQKATVSISLAGATTVATDIAQIVLMDGGLTRLPLLFDLAEEMEANMKNNIILSLAPSFMCIGGAFLLHFGIVPAMVIFFSGLFTGVGNSMLPLFKHRQGIGSEESSLT